MSDTSADPDVTELLADLTRELRRLQRAVEPDRRQLGRDLARLTSEVAIPALILLLKTNIQALELLRRTIRIVEGREPRGERAAPEMRERAERLGNVTLARLDDVLADLQTAVEGRPDDDRSQQLIQEARDIRQQIQDELEADGEAVDTDGEAADTVDIDVEAELRALKDDLNDDGDPDDRSGSGGRRGESGDGSDGAGPDGRGNDEGGSDDRGNGGQTGGL